MRVHRKGGVVVLEVWLFTTILEIGGYNHRTAWPELQTVKITTALFRLTSKWLLEKPDAFAL